MPTLAETLTATELESPVGRLRLLASRRGLRAVLWPDDNPRRVRVGDIRPAGARSDAGGDHLAAATAQLGEYFAGRRVDFEIDLDPAGTPFQRSVWEALRGVPFGTTVSYGALAAAAGHPGKARAVGAAVGRNPLSIVVPCHRVVGSDGSLTGFAGGLAAKRTLLALEAGAARAPGRS